MVYDPDKNIIKYLAYHEAGHAVIAWLVEAPPIENEIFYIDVKKKSGYSPIRTSGRI